MTQTQLLDIAISEFGAKGLEGASTRGIASAAGTAMSSITYHYGGKEGLYLAAADHIAARMAEEMTLALAADDAVQVNDRVAARGAVHRLLRHLLAKMAGDETEPWSLFIMREQLAPGEAFERIWAGMMGQVMRRLTYLICVATGVAMPSARIATLTLMGQALMVRASRASVLRLCEIATLDAATLASLEARIDANIDAILDRMIGEEQP